MFMQKLIIFLKISVFIFLVPLFCQQIEYPSLFIQALDEQIIKDTFGSRKISNIRSCLANKNLLYNSLMKLGEEVNSPSSRNIYYTLLSIYNLDFCRDAKKAANYFYLVSDSSFYLYSEEHLNRRLMSILDKYKPELPPNEYTIIIDEQFYPLSRPPVYLEQCFYNNDNCDSLKYKITDYYSLFEKSEVLTNWLDCVVHSKEMDWFTVKANEESHVDVEQLDYTKSTEYTQKEKFDINSFLVKMEQPLKCLSDCSKSEYNKDYLIDSFNTLAIDTINFSSEYLKSQKKILIKDMIRNRNRYNNLHYALKKGIKSQIPYKYTQQSQYTLNTCRNSNLGQNLDINFSFFIPKIKHDFFDLRQAWETMEDIHYEVKKYLKITGGKLNSVKLGLSFSSTVGLSKETKSIKIQNDIVTIGSLNEYIYNQLGIILDFKGFKNTITINESCSDIIYSQEGEYIIISYRLRYNNLFLHELNKLDMLKNKISYVSSLD